MKDEIRQQLMEYADGEYAAFSKKLIPDCKPLLGVRLPRLRTMAKALIKAHPEDWALLLAQEDRYFEEVMLRGMMIGYGCSQARDLHRAFKMLKDFVPLVDNWSVCDSCCGTFTVFSRYREETLEFLAQYLHSDREFEVRVGLMMLLNHFLKVGPAGSKTARRMDVRPEDLKPDREEAPGAYTAVILTELNRPFAQGYYAQMAAAWLTAECFVTFPKQTMAFLTENRMDDWTYNRSLQKICESRIPDSDVKTMIRALKRK